jgi:Cu(I)/Ag(I) efflux system membrane fusion protein
MKNKIIITVFSFLILLGCNNDNKKAEEHSTQYTCPMHPQIIRDEPGSCPICKMDLVPLSHETVKVDVDRDLANLIEPSNESITSNINTIKVKESSNAVTINLDGKVTYNTNKVNVISSRVSGRIENLNVKYNFQSVKKGQKLMEIYSPELAAAQQEMLYLRNNNDAELLSKAKTKLRLLGVPEAEIRNILRSGKVTYKIPVYSNYSGYLIAANATNDLENNANTPLAIKEGDYINTGDILFKVFNANQVWAEFFVNAEEGKNLKIGEEIKIMQGELSKKHQINFMQPFYKDGFNYQVIRVYLENRNQQYKIGEILSAKIILKPETGIWVPKETVYQLGQKNIVFVKKGNVLKPKSVTIAQASAKAYLIKEGLSVGEDIATNAAFLIDTQSFIITN